MADDIDIEEHDVLDSLRRRHMPDAVVKTEPVDAEDTEPQHDDSSNGYFESQWNWESGVDAPEIKVETPAEEEFQFGKIILGSKPSQNGQVDQTQVDNIEQNGRDSYNYNMSLVLEDWGPILQKSNCFCPECEILFATVNALDAHKMMAHSFLVATDKEASPERNKAIKSTARPDNKPTCEICHYEFQGTRGYFNLMKHYRHIHEVDPSDVEAMRKLKNWKICNHCNVYFPSDTDLVKHLYELLPLNDNKTPTKVEKRTPTPVKVPSAVKANLNENVKVPIVRTYDKKPAQPVKSAVAIPTSSNTDVKTVKVKNTTIVKDEIVKPVKPTVTKQNNSIILGTKVNNTELEDVKMEPAILKCSTERKCEVCGIEYSHTYYNQHMRKFHLDFLLSKMAKRKKGQPNTDRFKCKLCNKIMIGKVVAKKHRIKHPNVGRQKILIRMASKMKAQPKAVVKKEAPAEEKSDIVVSKSTLFKCNRCSSHFLTCYGACAHSRVCESSSNLRYWSCPQCQRVFKNTDKKAHEFQHKTNSAKFKVYVVYLEMVVRILCECPFCYVCFEEYKFWRHINFGCDRDAESFYCNECRLPIDASSRVSHESKHTQGDFTKEDFIKIDFISSKKELGEMEAVVKSEAPKEIPTPTLKRKLPAPEVEAKKIKRQPKDVFHLYYCSSCKCYLNRRIPYHTEGECKELNKKISGKIVRVSCEICGISFTHKSYEPHKKLHKKYPNMTLSNMNFTRIADNKKIKPNPEYYPCKKCNVNFTCLSSRRGHECSSVKTFTCQVCKRKMDKAGQKSHMRFHSYGTATVKLTSSKIQQNAAKLTNQNFKLPEASSTEKLPELLMKYQSLTTLWNILYLCVTCDTFTDSYDKVVEHSQNHLTNMENYGVVIMKCQICNMKFDRECYRRHLELHAGSKEISRKSFKILKYDHTKLLSKDWLSFIDLPEDQKSQILSRSIYGEMISIKMKLVQQGPPEYTVYRCVQCQKCVSMPTLYYHIKLQNCLKGHKINCSYCNIAFSTKQPCEKHEELHKGKNLRADSFRIVEFNDSIDEEFYKKVIPEYSPPEGTDTAQEAIGREADFDEHNVKVIKGQKFYMFYKCGGCGASTLAKKYADRHVCSPVITKKTCPKCGLMFSKLHFHNRLHERYDFSKKNVFTKTFNNNFNNTKNEDVKDETESENSSKVDKKEEAKLYKCHCGLHYTSLKTIEKHYRMKNCSSVVREKCSQCNLTFDPIEVVNHLCKHHAQNRFKTFEIIIPTKKTLYKCNQCHVLFYNQATAAKHKDKCDGTGGIKCDQCGLAFHKSGIMAHREDHRTGGNLKPDCYVVTNIAGAVQTENNVLYKCKTCNIHFVAWATLRNHTVHHNHRKSQIETCKKCGLLFPHRSLLKHMQYHHGRLNIVDFQFKYFEIGDKYKYATPKKKEATVSDIEDAQLKPAKEYLKCKKCAVNFTDKNTLASHNQDRCSKELTDTCYVCDTKFALRNFKEHIKEHNSYKPLIQNDNVPKDNKLKGTDTILYKCRHCSLHFNGRNSIDFHMKQMSQGCVNKHRCVKCDECDIVFTSQSFIRHSSIHETFNLKRGDFKIITLPNLNDDKTQDSSSVTDEIQSQASNNDTVVSLDSSFELESTDTSKIGKSEVKVKLYKCGDCNVYFLTQRTCYKHTIKHTALNPKDFIECKLCGYQFTIMALQTHIKKHHAKDFNLEEVLVEEYQPKLLENNVPKIEIYYAIEKDQSRLVSTTSDVKNDPKCTVTSGSSKMIKNAEENDSSEITSNCNELTEKIDSKQNTLEIDYLHEDVDIEMVDDDVVETTASND